MIELKNFSKKYSGKKNSPFAVENFSMTCRKGSVTGLLGLNGAGKTTILKAVCARHFPSSGEVLINGINSLENSEKIRNITGFVKEEPDFQKDYTVFEFLKITALLHRVSKEDFANFLAGNSKLNISEFLNKKIGTLSKGQLQRLNFAQSLVYSPKILVLDEPASGLDPAQIIQMRNLVKSLKNDHTILLSTHLMQEVDSLCDYVYIIHKGRLIAKGSPEEITIENKCKNLEEAFFKLTNSQQ